MNQDSHQHIFNRPPGGGVPGAGRNIIDTFFGEAPQSIPAAPRNSSPGKIHFKAHFDGEFRRFALARDEKIFFELRRRCREIARTDEIKLTWMDEDESSRSVLETNEDLMTAIEWLDEVASTASISVSTANAAICVKMYIEKNDKAEKKAKKEAKRKEKEEKKREKKEGKPEEQEETDHSDSSNISDMSKLSIHDSPDQDIERELEMENKARLLWYRERHGIMKRERAEEERAAAMERLERVEREAERKLAESERHNTTGSFVREREPIIRLPRNNWLEEVPASRTFTPEDIRKMRENILARKAERAEKGEKGAEKEEERVVVEPEKEQKKEEAVSTQPEELHVSEDPERLIEMYLDMANEARERNDMDMVRRLEKDLDRIIAKNMENKMKKKREEFEERQLRHNFGHHPFGWRGSRPVLPVHDYPFPRPAFGRHSLAPAFRPGFPASPIFPHYSPISPCRRSTSRERKRLAKEMKHEAKESTRMQKKMREEYERRTRAGRAERMNPLKPFCVEYEEYPLACSCDVCGRNVIGRRFRCLICRDFDICEECEQKNHHTGHAMVRLYGSRTLLPCGGCNEVEGTKTIPFGKTRMSPSFCCMFHSMTSTPKREEKKKSKEDEKMEESEKKEEEQTEKKREEQPRIQLHFQNMAKDVLGGIQTIMNQVSSYDPTTLFPGVNKKGVILRSLCEHFEDRMIGLLATQDDGWPLEAALDSLHPFVVAEVCEQALEKCMGDLPTLRDILDKRTAYLRFKLRTTPNPEEYIRLRWADIRMKDRAAAAAATVPPRAFQRRGEDAERQRKMEEQNNKPGEDLVDLVQEQPKESTEMIENPFLLPVGKKSEEKREGEASDEQTHPKVRRLYPELVPVPLPPSLLDHQMRDAHNEAVAQQFERIFGKNASDFGMEQQEEKRDEQHSTPIMVDSVMVAGNGNAASKEHEEWSDPAEDWEDVRRPFPSSLSSWDPVTPMATAVPPTPREEEPKQEAMESLGEQEIQLIAAALGDHVEVVSAHVLTPEHQALYEQLVEYGFSDTIQLLRVAERCDNIIDALDELLRLQRH